MPGARRPLTLAGRPATFRRWILQDWRANHGYPAERSVLVYFRTAQWALHNWGRPGRTFAEVYRLLTALFVGVELPAPCTIGPRLRLFHPQAIVVSADAVLGADCVLRQNVTIGNVVRRDSTTGAPHVGDGVEFGAGCVVIGDLEIGDRAKIGALCMLREDVPAGGVVVGNPARLVRVDAP